MENSKVVTPQEEQTEKSQIVKFGQLDEKQLVEKATKMADMLVPIIDKKNLYTDIKGKKYVRAEGWTTMLAMLGIMPEVEWSQKLDREDELAYEARVILKTIDGKIISAAEAMCSSKEKNWNGRDEYAIRSMAQTRATGKAARLPFAWIMSLAGYEATPAEEIDEPFPTKSRNVETNNNADLASEKQIKLIFDLAKSKLEAKNKEEAVDLIGLIMGTKIDIKKLTKQKAKTIIEFLMNYKKDK